MDPEPIPREYARPQVLPQHPEAFQRELVSPGSRTRFCNGGYVTTLGTESEYRQLPVPIWNVPIASGVGQEQVQTKIMYSIIKPWWRQRQNFMYLWIAYICTQSIHIVGQCLESSLDRFCGFELPLKPREVRLDAFV